MSCFRIGQAGRLPYFGLIGRRVMIFVKGRPPTHLGNRIFDAGSLHDLRSASKSVTSAILGTNYAYFMTFAGGILPTPNHQPHAELSIGPGAAHPAAGRLSRGRRGGRTIHAGIHR